MAGGEFVADRVQHRLHRGVRNIAQGRSRLVRRSFPEQLLDAYAELRFRRPFARDFEAVLEIGGRLERPGEGAPALREIGQIVEETLGQNRVEAVGMGAEVARDARRAADDLGDEAEQRRAGGEQREQLHPRR